MSNKIKYVELTKEQADEILEKIDISNNNVTRIPSTDFPAIKTYPPEYSAKIEAVTISTSACSFENLTTINCVFHRRDKDKIDQDEFGFYIVDNCSPSISGCMVYHGDYHGRTEDYSKAIQVLDQIANNDSVPLSEKYWISGFEMINENILRMKRMIEQNDSDANAEI